MKVWRVENDRGEGPYMSDLRFEDAMQGHNQSHDHYRRHPIARTHRNFTNGGKYGFSSRRDLDAWFGFFGKRGYDTLRLHGFRIAVYDVPACDVDDHYTQVIFNEIHASFVRVEEFI